MAQNSAPMRLGWILLGLLVVGLVFGGASILVGNANKTVPGNPLAGGGGPIPSRSSARPTAPPTLPPPSSTVTSIPDEPRPGSEISVAGTGNNRTIECVGNHVSISGVENVVVLTGDCSQVSVSGVDNTVTVGAAEAIVVSGIRNKVVYLSGEPHLSKSGIDNTLERG